MTNKYEIQTLIQKRLLAEMDQLNQENLALLDTMKKDRDYYTKQAVLIGKTHGLSLAFDIVTQIIKEVK
jgi:hypothetical protein